MMKKSLMVTLAALAPMLVLAAPGKTAAWFSDWIHVDAANGVKDDYYPLQRDPAKCSFDFRFARNADNTIGVEAFVRDDKVVVDDCAPGAISCTTWTDDCLEVFFDGDEDENPNTRGEDYENNPTPCNAGGEYAIAANGASQSDYASAKKCFGRHWGGVAEPWMKDGRRIGTHYDLWFGWECLNRPAPRPDEAVRLRTTVCIHDDDDGKACDYALYWKGNPKYPYADESAFGEIWLNGVPSGDFNTLVPVNWTCEAPEKHVKELRRMHDAYGLRKFVLIGPWCKRYNGTADVAAYAQTGRDIAFAKEALKDLKDVEIGWWLAPSISASQDFPGQRIMDCDGHVTQSSCPLSPEFTAALCARVKACVEIARPTVMFVEDDYTLANHGGMNAMKGCFCPLHLAAYAKRVGKAYAAQEIAGMFRRPTAENAPLRKAFAELMRDSLALLAANVRKAIDEVHPDMRVCLCQSGFVEVDGDSTEAVARAFAGKTRPMVRICGGGYFERNPSDLPGDLAHASWSCNHISKDVELILETDPYPHTRFFSSSLQLISLLAGAVAGGASGTYYYGTQYVDDPLSDPGYLDRLVEYRRRLAVVRDLRATMRPVGIRSVFDPAEVYLFRETEKPNAYGMLPVNAYFAGKLSLPMYAAPDGDLSILFGTTPNGLDDAAIAKILSGGVLVDGEAAVLLTKRGFGDLLGCTAEEMPEDFLFDHETILPASGCTGRGKMVYHRRIKSLPIIGWTPKKCVEAKLTPKPGAEEWSALYAITGEKVAPATLFYRNAKGGRVAVVNRSIDDQQHPSIYTTRKQELFHNLFDRLSDGKLDVSAPKTPSTWLVAARNDRELLVMVENLAGEPRPDISLRFSKEWQGARVERLRPDGSWEPLGLASADFVPPGGIFAPLAPEFLRVSK